MNKLPTILLVGLSLSLAPAAARAQDEWPGSERHCSGGNCTFFPTEAEARAALDEIRAEGEAHGPGQTASGLSEETWIALGAAAASGTGIAYGVGKYMTYRQSVRAAAEAATLLKRETMRVSRALSAALAPELERFGQAIIQANRSRIANGAAELTVAEIETALGNGLRSPQVRARILERLRASIGALAENAYEKFITSRNLGTMARELNRAWRMSAAGLGSIVLRDLGKGLAQTVVESLAPGLARYSVRAAASAAGTAAAASGGFLARCLGRLARVAGSPVVLALTILLEPSTASAATMDGFYAQQPEELFLLPREQAQRWLRYGNVRRSLVVARDVMREAGELSSNHSSAAGGEELLPAECRLEEEAPVYDETAGTCGG